MDNPVLPLIIFLLLIFVSKNTLDIYFIKKNLPSAQTAKVTEKEPESDVKVSRRSFLSLVPPPPSKKEKTKAKILDFKSRNNNKNEEGRDA